MAILFFISHKPYELCKSRSRVHISHASILVEPYRKTFGDKNISNSIFTAVVSRAGIKGNLTRQSTHCVHARLGFYLTSDR